MTWAICVPIAIALTMISGVLLGWPTLRLRGDYLAIVTLGFAEIIRIVAPQLDRSCQRAARASRPIPRPAGQYADGDTRSSA